MAFLGYDGCSKAYRLANVKQRKIVVPRDVVFLKEKFMKISQNSSHEMKRTSGDLVPFPFSSGSTIDVQTFNDSELFYDAEDSQDENEVEEHEEETDQEHFEHGEFENDQSQEIVVDHNLLNDRTFRFRRRMEEVMKSEYQVEEIKDKDQNVLVILLLIHKELILSLRHSNRL
ncbi:hypothetical protein ACKWTF_004494 [Chironomus riparius]